MPLDPRPAAWLIARVARAVDHAHRGGAFHGRLTPDSILLDVEGQPHVVGFGLAHAAAEQLAGSGGQVNTLVDLRALGAMLCECLLGPTRVSGNSSAVLIRKVMEALSVTGALLPRLDPELALLGIGKRLADP